MQRDDSIIFRSLTRDDINNFFEIDPYEIRRSLLYPKRGISLKEGIQRNKRV